MSSLIVVAIFLMGAGSLRPDKSSLRSRCRMLDAGSKIQDPKSRILNIPHPNSSLLYPLSFRPSSIVLRPSSIVLRPSPTSYFFILLQN
ncbi:MAG: hypothetical protein M0Q38_08765 [Bacteroidales bacterium]|nr:hypothetical protein [Bacteroidales bacterium]